MPDKKIIYSEPEEYIPKEVCEEFFPEVCVDAERYNEIAHLINCKKFGFVVHYI